MIKAENLRKRMLFFISAYIAVRYKTKWRRIYGKGGLESNIRNKMRYCFMIFSNLNMSITDAMVS